MCKTILPEKLLHDASQKKERSVADATERSRFECQAFKEFKHSIVKFQEARTVQDATSPPAPPRR